MSKTRRYTKPSPVAKPKEVKQKPAPKAQPYNRNSKGIMYNGSGNG